MLNLALNNYVHRIILCVLFLFSSSYFTPKSFAQGNNLISISASNAIPYKIIGEDTLKLILFHPKSFNPKKNYPAIIFFFGGGWRGGSIKQFHPQASYFASRGMIAILADYRVESRQGTTPFDATRDAKSAIRFLRKNAKKLNINKNKIVASGGSAGGHLAAATGVIPGLEESEEDLSISSKPNALVLFNPVVDNGPHGYGFDRIGKRFQEISPLHNITKGAPPTIIFLGTKDKLIPVKTAKDYTEKMGAIGSRCDLHLYKDQPHGFFNYRNRKYYHATVYQTDLFLSSLGFIKGKPSISKDY